MILVIASINHTNHTNHSSDNVVETMLGALSDDSSPEPDHTGMVQLSSACLFFQMRSDGLTVGYSMKSNAGSTGVIPIKGAGGL
jgi:hypothetical protein